MAGHSALSPEHHVNATRQAIHQVTGYLTTCLLKSRQATSVKRELPAFRPDEAASAPPNAPNRRVGGKFRPPAIFYRNLGRVFAQKCQALAIRQQPQGAAVSWAAGTGDQLFAGIGTLAIFSSTEPSVPRVVT
jgi:hypothetical protein